MHEQLDDYRSGFLALKDEARALVDGVGVDALRRSPDPETWSVAQVFDHMNTTGWLVLNSLEEAIEHGRENGPYGDPPFQYGFVSRWFVRSMKPSSRWTFTAPSIFEPEPTETLYPNETLEEFRALQDQFAECVISAEGLDLRRIRVPSPALPLLRISLGAWFEATLAHEQRHLHQARSILHTHQEPQS
jgi:hypothetical protein